MRVSDRLATASTSCGEGAVLVDEAMHGGGSVRSRAALTQALRVGEKEKRLFCTTFGHFLAPNIDLSRALQWR